MRFGKALEFTRILRKTMGIIKVSLISTINPAMLTLIQIKTTLKERRRFPTTSLNWFTKNFVSK